MLQVSGLRVDVCGVTLIDNVTFTVRAGEKVGLVGRNGAGKTSMLKVIGGADKAARGSVRYEGGMGYLPQDPRLDLVPEDMTGMRHVLSGRGLHEALERMEKLQAAMEADPTERAIDRYTRAIEKFRMDGGYSAEGEVRRLATGIGLDDEKLDLPLGALSGGQRRRVEVVRILFAGSDVLLLDEPTNHLDADAKAWMLDFLRGYRGALVVISHDLDLLDEAITRVIHLDRGATTPPGRCTSTRAPTRSTSTAVKPTRSARPSRSPCRPKRSIGCRTSSIGSEPRPARPRWPRASRRRSNA
ncbi:MAG: ATP-binding cassette domain-containing protein [Aquihabitans sp.]